MSSKLIHKVVLLSNGIFLVNYLILACNARLAIDDYYFIAQLNDHGVWGAAVHEYFNWNTRFLAMLINQVIHRSLQVMPALLPLYFVIALALVHCAVDYLVKVIPKKNLHMSIDSLAARVNLSFFLTSILFYSTVDIDHTWFWLASTTAYVMVAMFFILMIAIFLKKEIKPREWCLFACASLIVGSNSGPLGIALIFLAISFLVLPQLNKNSKSLQKIKSKQQRTILAGSFVLLGFCVIFFGPGNGVRSSFFKQISIAEALILNVKMSGILLLKCFPIKIAIQCLLLIPLIKFNETISINLKRLLQAVLCFGVAVYIYQLSVTYKTQDIIALRGLLPLTIASVFTIAIPVVLLIQKIDGKKYILKSSLVIPVALGIYVFFSGVKPTFNYAKTVDERMRSFKAQLHQDVIILPSLAPSGLLPSAELGKDWRDFRNRHFARAHNYFGILRVDDQFPTQPPGESKSTEQ